MNSVPASDPVGVPAAARICARCVMDTSDPEIRFDSDGICSHCRAAEGARGVYWFEGPDARRRLESAAESIRRRGKGRDYDCVVGLSGGVDSTWTAIVAARQMGLRPLAVHVDTGWNSELAVKNIETILRALDLDLVTEVIDWEVMRDLQTAFFKASVANQDTPQDHAIFSSVYRTAKKFGISTILAGFNYQSESILPRAWGYTAMDGRQLRAIHRRFGSGDLGSYPVTPLWDYWVTYPRIYGIGTFAPLNYVEYRKDAVVEELRTRWNWKPYGRKHGESRFTKFFQNYYLPAKFGFDKRRAHLSSLIAAGQISRETALVRMAEPLYEPIELMDDREFVRKKLRLSEGGFEAILNLPNRTYRDFPNDAWLRTALEGARRVLVPAARSKA